MRISLQTRLALPRYKVTDRANTEIPSSAIASQASFRDFFDERGRNLYFEFGKRRQDLIRLVN